LIKLEGNFKHSSDDKKDGLIQTGLH